MPVTLASDQDSLAVTGTFWQATQPVSGTFYQATQPVTLPTIGTAGNGWNNDPTGVLGNSNAIDCQNVRSLSIFETSSGATTFTLFASQNNGTYSNTGIFETLAGPGDFYFNAPNFSARYARVQSSANQTVVLTIAGK